MLEHFSRRHQSAVGAGEAALVQVAARRALDNRRATSIFDRRWLTPVMPAWSRRYDIVVRLLRAGVLATGVIHATPRPAADALEMTWLAPASSRHQPRRDACRRGDGLDRCGAPSSAALARPARGIRQPAPRGRPALVACAAIRRTSIPSSPSAKSRGRARFELAGELWRPTSGDLGAQARRVHCRPQARGQTFGGHGQRLCGLVYPSGVRRVECCVLPT